MTRVKEEEEREEKEEEGKQSKGRGMPITEEELTKYTLNNCMVRRLNRKTSRSMMTVMKLDVPNQPNGGPDEFQSFPIPSC
ncbi:hypothetical protein H920_17397 [Fukomys damarensis]|uniref:Uncharacterized protein n=1 Tax=Fukomys damarensis TaxID=885580 RepID=A0A091CUD9_FUKDA|nr:hypothetical protein H920_17397 [Fukomys damarensis]